MKYYGQTQKYRKKYTIMQSAQIKHNNDWHKLTEKDVLFHKLVARNEHGGDVDATYGRMRDACKAVHFLLVALFKVPTVAFVADIARADTQFKGIYSSSKTKMGQKRHATVRKVQRGFNIRYKMWRKVQSTVLALTTNLVNHSKNNYYLVRQSCDYP